MDQAIKLAEPRGMAPDISLTMVHWNLTYPTVSSSKSILLR